MVTLLRPDPVPFHPSIDVQLRRLVISLRAEHPELSAMQLYDLFLDKADDAASRMIGGEAGAGRPALQQQLALDA